MYFFLKKKIHALCKPSSSNSVQGKVEYLSILGAYSKTKGSYLNVHAISQTQIKEECDCFAACFE